MSTSFLLKCLVKNYVFYLSIIIRDKNIIKVKYWFCGSPGVLEKGLRWMALPLDKYTGVSACKIRTAWYPCVCNHSSKPLPQDTIAPAKIIFCVESEKNMEYNPINALKMKSFSGYTPKKPYRWAVTNVCCQFLCIPVIPEKSFVTRGYKHVGMRLAYFACPYPYAFVKRECPRDAKRFYGITGKQK